MSDTPPTSTFSESYGTWSWSEAREHFEQVDPALFKLVRPLNNPQDSPPRPAFESLSRAIIGQQLSTKAAHTIWSRLVELHGGILAADQVLRTSEAQHRSVGVSAQKHRYLQDLSRCYAAQPDVFDKVSVVEDAAIVEEWTRVKGIGTWTVQMHLMSQLRRPDVFPVDDLGIRRAMERGLGIPKDSKKSVYAKRALVWSPFRTAASRFLWESLNAQPK